MEWFCWMRGSDPCSWNKTSTYEFIKVYLASNRPLWIAGDNKSVSKVARVFQTDHEVAQIAVFPNENYESIRLSCKKKDFES
jgi:hypothetical protein